MLDLLVPRIHERGRRDGPMIKNVSQSLSHEGHATPVGAFDSILDGFHKLHDATHVHTTGHEAI